MENIPLIINVLHYFKIFRKHFRINDQVRYFY